jgi:hypothetical protein
MRIEQRAAEAERELVGDLAGIDLPNTPRWQLTLAPEYRFDAGNYQVRIGANMLFSDGYILSTNGDPLHAVDDYDRIDLRFALAPTDGNWEIAVYGRDVTDERVTIGWAPTSSSRARRRSTIPAGSPASAGQFNSAWLGCGDRRRWWNAGHGWLVRSVSTARGDFDRDAGRRCI